MEAIKAILRSMFGTPMSLNEYLDNCGLSAPDSPLIGCPTCRKLDESVHIKDSDLMLCINCQTYYLPQPRQFYVTGVINGHPFMVCKLCQVRTYDAEDIKLRYCPNCHLFLE